MDDDPIGTAEAAAILGASVRALSTRARRGSVPHVGDGAGTGRRYRFRRAEILALADAKAAKRRATRNERTRAGPRLVGTAEAVAGWNADPTPFAWGGTRAARRQRARQRRPALGGSGGSTHRPIRRRLGRASRPLAIGTHRGN